MLMGAGMGTAILLYSVGYMEQEEQGVTRFYAIMLVFIAGFVVLACSANLLGAYLAWELIGLCSYFLVGFWYEQQVAADGARKVLMITHIAGYGLLAAIILLYARPEVRLDRSGGRRRPSPAASPHDHRLGDGEVGHVSAAHLDPRGDECADAGFRAAALGLLRQCGAYLIARMYSSGRGMRRSAICCW